MIGVICKPSQKAVVEEFFQLFKTPWEFYEDGRSYRSVISTVSDKGAAPSKLTVLYGSATASRESQIHVSELKDKSDIYLNFEGYAVPLYGETKYSFEGLGGEPCLTANAGILGFKTRIEQTIIIRVGYDLFEEVKHLLLVGQPAHHASIPTLDIHIQILRNWLVEAGIPIIEIPPIPAGHPYAVCLTHDIDFLGIRQHKFDHTMWGFLFRSTVGAARHFFGGRISFWRLLKNWIAAMALPLVYMGWIKDYWQPFRWYLSVEKGLPTTYFLIPFKNRKGDNVSSDNPHRRSAKYDIGDIPEWTAELIRSGCELGVHGIDAWHDKERAEGELLKISEVTKNPHVGIRMHWLLKDGNTARVLDETGFMYDSSYGYNETIGFLNGTAQVFRPLGCRHLLELPLHIQDGALFLDGRLALSETAASALCGGLISRYEEKGGVLTTLWHDRSPGPERFWGGFYRQLLARLRSRAVWFGTASQVVAWFQERRETAFETTKADGNEAIRIRATARSIEPPFRLRIYNPGFIKNLSHLEGVDTSHIVDIDWSGKEDAVFVCSSDDGDSGTSRSLS